MKYFMLVFTIVWASLPLRGEAQNLSDPGVIQMIDALKAAVPDCAFNCIVQEVTQSTCDVTNTTCICTNTNLTSQIQLCLGASCTVVEELQTVKYQTSACGGPVHNTSGRLRGTTWGLFPIVMLFVVGRIIARLPALGGNLSWDDYMILVATVGVIATSVVCEGLVKSGLGRDMWMLSPAQITHTLLLFFIAEILYAFVVLTTKLSILLCYIRIFNKKSFKIQCYILMGISCCHGLAGWLAQPFICRPTSFFWQGWDGQHVGRCPININSQTYAMAATNITLDVLIFAVPIPQLLPLQMSTRKKIGVAIMFLVGLIVIRLWTITVWGRTTNPTLDYLSLGLWSIIELDVGILCTCMPGMAILVRRVLPRAIETLKNGSQKATDIDGFRTHRGDTRMDDSFAKVSKAANIRTSIYSKHHGDGGDDDYELLGRMP